MSSGSKDIPCANNNATVDVDSDSENGEQTLLNHGEHIAYEYHPNNILTTIIYVIYSSTREHQHRTISRIKFYINSDINIGIGKIVYGSTIPRRERRILCGTEVRNDTVGPTRLRTSSICLRRDEPIGYITPDVRNIMRRLTDTDRDYTDNIVSTDNDNATTSVTNANPNGRMNHHQNVGRKLHYQSTGNIHPLVLLLIAISCVGISITFTHMGIEDTAQLQMKRQTIRMIRVSSLVHRSTTTHLLPIALAISMPSIDQPK